MNGYSPHDTWEVRRLKPGEKKTDAGAVAAKTLSDRKKSILKAIVETHINLGEPVGSKYLTIY